MNKWKQIHRRIFHRKGHGVHSPFVFDLITNVIEQPLPFYAYKDIDLIRLHLRLHGQPVTYQGKQSSVQKYLQKQEISKKEGELLFRLTNHYKLRSIFTIGAGLGLIPLYLTGYTSGSQCIALEPENEIAGIAEKIIRKYGNESIRIIQGNYNQTVPDALNLCEKIDCLYISKLVSVEETAFIYETCKPLIHDETIMIISGIHTSTAKHECWKHLCEDPKITVSVDLGKLGLIFFRSKLHKRMYKNWF